MGALSDRQLEQVLAVQRHDGGRLGDLVVGRGLVSPFALVAALTRQKRLAAGQSRASANGNRPSSWRPLGRILISRHRISAIQLQQALADQREGGGYLGELLLERGWITAAELVQALSEQLQTVGAAGNVFSVREQQADGWRTLHTTSSFIEASDFVFEQVLAKREPERLEIACGQGTWEEIAWSYERPQTQTPPTAVKLLEAFQLLAELAQASYRPSAG